ncbi:MAG: T9SS type A sorting domain-containing protein [bacterium]
MKLTSIVGGVFVALTLAMPIHAAPPTVQSASYDAGQQILTVTFDQPISANAIDRNSFSIAFGPDYSLTLRTVPVVEEGISVSGNSITVSLLAEGTVDESQNLYTYMSENTLMWGRNLHLSRQLATQSDASEVRLGIAENAVVNLSGESNTQLRADQGIAVTLTGTSLPKPVPTVATYDIARGKISVTFNRKVLCDLFPEDKAETGTIGVLDMGEDLDGDGVLDHQVSIFPEAISIKNTDQNEFLLGTCFLSSESRAEYGVDSLTLVITLPILARRALDQIGGAGLTLVCRPWAFTGTEYAGSAPANLTLGMTDPTTVAPDSAIYDLGTNQLRLVFAEDADWTGLMYGSNVFYGSVGGSFQLFPGTVQTTVLNGDVVIVLGRTAQETFERFLAEHNNTFQIRLPGHMIYSTDQRSFGGAAAYTHAGNPGGQSEPLLLQANYDAATNEVGLVFSSRVSIGSDLLLDRVHLLHLGDELAVEATNVSTATTNTTNDTYILQLSEGSAKEIESVPGHSGLSVLLDPFAVVSYRFRNGNIETDSITLTYHADGGAPVPVMVLLDETLIDLVVQFNREVVVNGAYLSNATFSGVVLSAGSVFAEDARTLRFNLEPNTWLLLNALDIEDKVDPVLSLPEGLAYSTDGEPSPAMTGVTLGEDLSGFGGTGNLIAGWAHFAVIPSLRNFPQQQVHPFLLRRTTTYARLFADVFEYGLNVTEADLDSLVKWYDTENLYQEVGALMNLAPEDLDSHDLFVTDVADAYDITGYDDENTSLYYGSWYVAGDATHDEGLFLDCYPQEISNISSTARPAMVEVLTQKLASDHYASKESWLIRALTLDNEFLLAGRPAFYDGLSPLTISLHLSVARTLRQPLSLFEQNGSREMWKRLFLFAAYLHQHYGGDDLLREIWAADGTGMDAVSAGVEAIQIGSGLPEPYQSRDIDGILADFGVATLADAVTETGEGQYSLEGITVQNASFGVPLCIQGQPLVAPLDTWSNARVTNLYGYINYDQLDEQDTLYVQGAPGSVKVMVIRKRSISDPWSTSDFRVDPMVLDESSRGKIPMSLPDWIWSNAGTDSTCSRIEVMVSVGDVAEGIQAGAVFSGQPDTFLPPSFLARSVPGTNEVVLDLYLPMFELPSGGETTASDIQEIKKGLAAKYASSARGSKVATSIGGFTGFNIKRSNRPDGEFEQIASNYSSSEYVDHELTPGRTYVYRVSAQYSNPAGESEPVSRSVKVFPAGSTSSFATAVSNFGVYGDPNGNFPSMEWPMGSGIYYLWEGRFWVGALEEGVPRVSHADYGNYEFTPAWNEPYRLSILGTNQFRVEADYNDLDAGIGGHTPLGVVMHEITRTWLQSEDPNLAPVLMINMDVHNVGTRRLEDVYYAWVFDADIGCGPGGSHHANGGAIDDMVGFDADRLMPYMFDVDDPLTPENDQGEFGMVPGYLGAILLHGPDAGETIAHTSWWSWSDDPGNDLEKYQFMSGTHPSYDGMAFRETPDLVGGTPFDYRWLMSAGPHTLEPNEVQTLQLALMIGDGLEDLQNIADYAIDHLSGTEEPAVVTVLPERFRLRPAWPNPFNPSTSISIDLPVAAPLTLVVYNILGREVATLHNGMVNAGTHTFRFDGSRLASGVYFVRAAVPGERAQVRRIVLMK